MADVTPPAESSLTSVVEWRSFLADYPLGTRAPVEGVLRPQDGRTAIEIPELLLFCDDCGCGRYCKGNRRASGFLFPGRNPQECHDSLLIYDCSKCGIAVKSYAVRLIGNPDTWGAGTYCEVAKLGEWPPFSFRTPSKVNSLVGPDRNLFFKGRKAESEGLGVGAFAYYRRIVEDQKNRLLDDIIRVAQRTNAPPDAIAKLEAAKKEIQFHKAVDQVKDVIPPSLLIGGRNPLTLLHNALSRDLHGASDEECLQVAHDVRVVLCELAERLGDALKDEDELMGAVSRLLNRKS